ncbi:acetyl-CoA hydrolase, partial [Clostridioides difficile]|nr:acetyl-CoA hydrolase [Clostridioides difficile]
GPNYRWPFMNKYPDGITKEEGEKWFYEAEVPYFTNCCYVNRYVSSKRMINYGATDLDRVSELWIEGEEEWHKAAGEETKSFSKKPERAQEEEFPYLKPQFNIASESLEDIATLDAY